MPDGKAAGTAPMIFTGQSATNGALSRLGSSVTSEEGRPLAEWENRGHSAGDLHWAKRPKRRAIAAWVQRHAGLKLSLSLTERLKTRAPGLESLLSTQK